VLFCDLVGSTPLSQQLDAEEWRDLIAQYQQAASGAVGRFGGHVARKLGDGLLIYFGWPTAREDDPERAVRAGLAIVDALGPLNAALAAGDGPRLAVRIGLHTGPVVIADDGEVFGETPNIAARVQGAAEPDTVVITAATQRLVAGMFVVQDRGPQMLTGVREPVTLYRVAQPSGVRSRLAVAAGRLTRFVGREVELATVIERWGRAQDGEGQTVVVGGEAGIGKSRLVYQFHEHLTAMPHTWLECGATPYTEGTPFHPVIALVAQGLALAPEDTAAAQLGKLESGLGALASPEAVALLAAFLGLLPPTPLQMSPELQRRKTIDLLVQWTLALSAAQPLVVCVEDLHWCDASTLELLGQLIAQSATARVMLLATARHEFTPPWAVHSNLTTVQLPRLTKREAHDMVTALGGRVLPADTRDALVARADGVPLYIEELTKAVAAPEAAIPATLADSLMARLDRLSAAKEVAQRAAVLGREFSYPLAAAALGLEETVLRHGLGRLVDTEILFARGEPPAATYIFKHALVREAAYGSLLKRVRRDLHGRVVRALVERFPERAETEPEVVARHAEAAGTVDDAITYYHRAGMRAQERSAHEEAIGHLRKGIGLLAELRDGRERDARESSLQFALGASLVTVRGYSHPETGAAFERAQVLSVSLGDASQRIAALAALSTFHTVRGDPQRGAELGRMLLVPEGENVGLVLAHLMIGVAEYFQGKFASSLSHCEKAIEGYEQSRDCAILVSVVSNTNVSARCHAASDLWSLGYPDRALTCVQEAVAHARKVNHPFSLGMALFYESAIHCLRGDPVAQRRSAEEAILLSEAQGFPLWLGLGKVFRGHARAVAEADPTGLAEVADGLTLASGTGAQGGAPVMLGTLAHAHMAVGHTAEAMMVVQAALAIGEQTGQPLLHAEFHRAQGEFLLATSAGTAIDAESSFRRALEIAQAQEARSLELRVAMSLARLWQSQGKAADARALLAPLYAWFTEGFDTGDLISAKALLDELT
jgi:class 3 adenylate cyclase/predicted ATPase